MIKHVKKAVIPVAGLGTRFLPASKTIPKELFPIVDRPILLFLVEEAVKAGIEDIVLISGRGKNSIEDFFDTSHELESHLLKNCKQNLMEDILRIKSLCNIISVRQKEPLGLGHAILVSQCVIGDSPFAVLLGDELMIHSPSETSVTGQLIERYHETGLSTVAVMEVHPSEVTKYGIIDYSAEKNGQFKIHSLVEKPPVNEAPSHFALPGRYVFTPHIFRCLEKVTRGQAGEIQLTDGMTLLAKEQGLIGSLFQGDRFDAGDKFGYLQANIAIGLKHPETAEKLRQHILHLASIL